MTIELQRGERRHAACQMADNEAVLALALALAIGLLTGQGPSLLAKSEFICRTDGWQGYSAEVGDYLWWSPTKILALLADDRRQLIDLQSKTKRDIEIAPKFISLGQLSPDRSKVLVTILAEHLASWSVVDLQGKLLAGPGLVSLLAPVHTPDSDEGYINPEAVWSDDGKTILQIQAWANDDGETLEIVKFALDGLRPGLKVQLEKLPSDSYPLIHGNQVILQRNDLDDGEIPKTFQYVECDLSHPVVRKTWTVNLPPGWVVAEFIPSPDFKRALWLFGKPGAGLKPTKNRPFPMTYPYRAISLWTSGLHGEKMTEVGELDFASDDEAIQEIGYQLFGNLKWSPDKKRASFIYRWKLYTVPV